MADVRSLVELGMVPPLAVEVGAQIDAGAGNAQRLVALSLPPPTAVELAAQITAGVVDQRRLSALGIVPQLAKAIAALVTGGLKPSDTILAWDGDSRIATNFTNSGARRDSKGPLFWSAFFSSQKFDTSSAQNVAVSGQTSAQILARASATAALPGNAVAALMSTNDRGVLTPTQSLQNIAAWISAMRAAGKVVFIGDETPRGDLTSGTVPPLADHIAVRDGIRAMNNPAGGVYVVPTWAAVASPGDPDMADLSLYYDNVHPNPSGGARLGAAYAAVVNVVYPVRDVLSAGPNYIANGVMAGVAGTVTAPAAGQVADGWTLNQRADLLPVVATGSLVVDGNGKRWQRVVALGTPTNNVAPEARMLQTISTAPFVTGDVCEVLARLKINRANSPRDIRFGILYGNGGASEVWDGSQFGTFILAGGPWEGVVRSPQFTIPATNTLMRVLLSIQGFQNVAVDLDAQITDVVIRKVL